VYLHINHYLNEIKNSYNEIQIKKILIQNRV